jgi:preprotein translocase subunit SecF
LPGIAAMALTLGMAIDANVLINERIREELRNGMPPQAAIHTGYDRALGTILRLQHHHADRRPGLLIFGSGPVRGFAVVHCLGILTSMFSAVVVSRGLVNLIYGRRRKLTVGRHRPGLEARHGRHCGRTSTKIRKNDHGIFPHQKDIPFMRHALVFNVISLVTFPAAVFFLFTRGLHLSVEFTGGTLIESAIHSRLPISKRSAWARQGWASPMRRCRTSAPARDVMIRLPLKGDQNFGQQAIGDQGAEAADARRQPAPRRVRRPAGRQGTGRKRRNGAAAGDHRHHDLPGVSASNGASRSRPSSPTCTT